MQTAKVLLIEYMKIQAALLHPEANVYKGMSSLY